MWIKSPGLAVAKRESVDGLCLDVLVSRIRQSCIRVGVSGMEEIDAAATYSCVTVCVGSGGGRMYRKGREENII